MIYILRHGKSKANIERIYTGQLDCELSKQGIQEAETAGDYILKEKIKFDKIYSSDLQRAYKTAEIVAEKTGLPVTKLTAFREICVGDWEGKKIDELLKLKEYKNWTKKLGKERALNGESPYEAGKRFYDELRKIVIENKNKNLLVVSHSFVIRCFLCYALNIDTSLVVKALKAITNCSLTTVEYDEKTDRFSLKEYSEDSYLPEAEADVL